MKNLNKFILMVAVLSSGILFIDNSFAETYTDGDGIDDKVDSCPTQAETINGFEDTDGCPDVVPENNASEKTTSDGAFFQWTAIIAAGISAAGGIAAAKYRKR